MAMLIANANRPVSLDELVTAAWDQPPGTAGHQVRNRVSDLRNVLRRAGLAHDTIGNAGTGYTLVVADGQCDAAVFEAGTVRATAYLAAGRLAEAEQELTNALSMWYGTALEGLTTAPLMAIAAGLSERRKLAREQLFDVAIQLGRHETVISGLQTLAAEEPWRERPVGLLMTALYRAGRQREALDQFAAFSRRLSDDLGLDPGPGLIALRDNVLRQDGKLGGAAAVAGLPAPLQHAVAWHPPPPLADFVGRREEFVRVEVHMHARLEAGTAPIVAISGLPGVGKTSLAISALHQLRRDFPVGQLYVDLRGHTDPRDPVQVMHRFLRTIGVESERIPSDPDEAADLYRSMLSRSPRLVLLDNAADAAQIASLVPAAECPLVITSRRMLTDLDGALFLAMDPFTEEEAIELLAAAVGSETVVHHRDAALSIVKSCGHLPLAVRIASAQALAVHGRLDDVAHRLSDSRQVLNHLATAERSVRTSFQSAFDLLAPSDQQLLCDLGIATTDDFPQWVAHVAHDGGPEVAEASLRRLTEAGFVSALGPDALGQQRYQLHDLVRQFGVEQAHRRQSALERRETQLRVMEAWHTLTEEAGKAFDHSKHPTAAPSTAVAPAPTRRHLDDPTKWFALESAAILDLARRAAAAGLHRQCWTLIWHSEHYLTRDARQPELLGLAHLALESARRDGDALGVACASLMLAFANAHMARLDAAQSFAREGLAAAESAGNLWLQAEIFGVLGQLFARLGEVAQQRQALERAVALHLQVGDLIDAGGRLVLLSEAAAREDDGPAAAEYLERGLALLRQSPAVVPLARALRRAALRKAKDEAWPEAVELYRECLVLLTDVDEPAGELSVRTDLAVALLRLDDMAEASEHIKHAMSLGDRVKGPQYIAYAMMGHGILLAHKGDLAGAGAMLRNAVEGMQTLPFHLALPLVELGMIYHSQGDPRAEGVLREAIEVAERFGDKGVAARARTILGKARVAAAGGGSPTVRHHTGASITESRG